MKNMFWGWVFVSKWEGLESKNKHFALYLLQNMSFLGVVKYRIPKRTNIEAKNVPRSNFCDLGAFGGESKLRRWKKCT